MPIRDLDFSKRAKDERVPARVARQCALAAFSRLKRRTAISAHVEKQKAGKCLIRTKRTENCSSKGEAAAAARENHDRAIRTRTSREVGERRHGRGHRRGLTESKLTRAKMAKVETLSHTHLVLDEWTGTALQLRADQDPSREELHKEGEAEATRR